MNVKSIHFTNSIRIKGLGQARDITVGEPAKDGIVGTVAILDVDDNMTLLKLRIVGPDGKDVQVFNRGSTEPLGSEIRVRIPDGASCVFPKAVTNGK